MSEGGIRLIWPTPLLIRKLDDAQSINSELVKILRSEMENKEHGHTVYANHDHGLQNHKSEAMQKLFSFITECIFDVAKIVNAPLWAAAGIKSVDTVIVDSWYQVQNNYGFHDIHHHGNCSWSGVYYVQIDDVKDRQAHPNLGKRNGITRFYGHGLTMLGAGFADLGNDYINNTIFDITPEEGTLVVFPSWLLHKAFPYDGKNDRIIISFNAQINGDGSENAFKYQF